MSTHNIPFFNMKTKKHPKLSQICSYGIFSKALKNEFERAVVNEPSMFEPLKFYCIYKFRDRNVKSKWEGLGNKKKVLVLHKWRKYMAVCPFTINIEM